MPLAGLRVLSLESRRSNEIDLLIRKQGGQSFVAPSVRERPLEDHTDAFRLLDGLESSAFDMLVLMTGTGLSFSLGAMWWRRVTPSPGRTTHCAASRTLARGPKPSAILPTAGLSPDITIPEPNTWREVVDVMRGRSERSCTGDSRVRDNPIRNWLTPG